MTNEEMHTVLNTMHRMLLDIGTGSAIVDKAFDDYLRQLEQVYPGSPTVVLIRHKFDLLLSTNAGEQDRNRTYVGTAIAQMKTEIGD